MPPPKSSYAFLRRLRRDGPVYLAAATFGYAPFRCYWYDSVSAAVLDTLQSHTVFL